MSKLDWTDLDKRAVDTARVLAMDAVQRVGNGHPGTAMSLAPVAYTLFQKAMRHNPADPDWAGRDRFVLSARAQQHHPLHRALPGRVRPRARRPQGAAHLGQQDPGPPRARPHRRRGDHHRPARPGCRQRGGDGDGRPPRARPVRPRGRPGREPLRPPDLLHLQRRRPGGGRQRRGLLARRHPAAGQPHADLRRQRDLHRGRHRHRLHRGRRGALRGVRLARPAHRLDQRRHPLRGERPGAVGRDREGPARHRQAELHRPQDRHRLAGAERAGHRQGARLGARRRGGGGDQEDHGLRPRADLRGRPRRDRAHPWRRGARQAGRRPRGRRPSTPGPTRDRRAQASCSTGCATRTPARRLDRRAADLPGRRQGRRHPQGASGEVLTAIAPELPELWGGSADLAGSNNTTPKGEPSFIPAEHVHQGVLRRPVRPGAALRHPRARHGRDDERHRAARRHPASTAARS